MRVDAHQHFWAVARGDYGWLTEESGPIYRDFAPRDLAPLLDANNIDKTVIVQAAPSIEETEYLLGIADATDFVGKIVRPVDWVNNPPYFFITTWLLFEELAGIAFLTDKTVVRISFLYTVDY